MEPGPTASSASAGASSVTDARLHEHPFWELSRDLLTIADLESQFLHLNAEWERVLGWSREELLQRPYLEFVHPEDHSATKAAMAQLSEERDVVGFENRYRCEDGSYQWLRWSASSDIETGRIYATARVVTDEKERLGDLERREAQQRALNQVLAAAQESLEVREVASAICRTTTSALGASRVTILLEGETDQVVRIVGSHDLQAPSQPYVGIDVPPDRLPSYHEALLTTMAEQQPVEITDLPDSIEDPERRRIFEELGSTSVLHLPLDLGRQGQGVLSIHARGRKERLGPTQRVLAREIAHHASAALGQALLHRELERRGSLLEEAQRIGGIGNWQWDPETDELTWSRQLFRIFGRDRDGGHPVYQEYIEQVHPDDRNAVRQALEEAMADAAPFDVQHRILRPDGETRYLSCRGEVVTDDRGRPVRMVGTAHDVTQLMETQIDLERTLEVLERQATMLREAQRIGRIGHLMWDPDSQWVTFSEEMVRLWGFDPDRVDQITIEDLLHRVHEEDRQALRRAIEDGLREGTTARIDFRIRLPDGAIRWVEARNTVETDPDDGRPLYRATIQDITDRKRIEESQEQALEEAQAAERAKSEFLATMSHEIRTPLNAIIGMTGLLLETELDPEQTSFAQTVRTSGSHLLTLINDVLDLSKLQAGRLDLERQPFSPLRTVEEVLDLVAHAAAKKGLALTYDIGDDVPDGVLGDPGRLRQVLLNLLSNAVKFTDEGEVTLRVHTESDPAKDLSLVFEVEDTGIGIEPEDLDRMFHAFSQADASTTRRHGGTGLGLAIVRHLVERMGGRIEVHSAVGQGSTFRFRMPTQRADVGAPSVPRGRVPDLAGQRALVVEANDSDRTLLEKLLRQWGMEVVTVADATEALDRLADGPRPDLLVLDDVTVGPRGPELGDLLRPGDEAPPPVVLLRGLTATPGALDQLVSDPARTITKPLKPSLLLSRVRSTLRTPSGEGAKADPAGHNPCCELRILLAEDNHVNQKVALRMLESLGYQADVAADGEEVLEAMDRARYDLVLMDLGMPTVDGFEASERIRDQLSPDQQPRIVAMTAHVGSHAREKAQRSGMDDHLAKPVTLEALEGVLFDACATSPRCGQAPLVDDQGLDALDRSLQGRLPPLVAAFLETVPDHLSALARARAAGDPAALADGLHDLRGGAASVAATRLAARCARIEPVVRDGRMEEVADELDQLPELTRETATALEQWASEHGASRAR